MSSHARETSASGTARALVCRDPSVIAAASEGSSARISATPTDPCPLPVIRRAEARRAADGTGADRPATDPIETQERVFPRSPRAVTMAAIAAAAGSPQR